MMTQVNAVTLNTSTVKDSTVNASMTLATERYRDYLQLLVRLTLGEKLHGRFDSAGVVMQTLREGDAAAEQFERLSPSAKAGWLRVRLLARLEEELEGADLGDVLLPVIPDDGAETPVDERALRLVEALALLPEMQRDVVIWHHWGRIPLAVIAERVGKDVTGTVGLLKRAMQRLRELMHDWK